MLRRVLTEEPASAEPWSPPAEFDGYRLLHSVGQGRTGHVFLAVDTYLDRPVALKFVHEPGPGQRERFLVEARAIARLQHPNVVAIYRVGEVEGRWYLASEFVRGRTLAEVARPMPWREALRVGVDLVRGLAAAHRRGVLHRDIKPANAILSEDGEAKLLDFGLAKLVDEPRPRDSIGRPASRRGPTMLALFDETHEIPASEAASTPSGDLSRTPPGTAMGTPLYMAPEVWRGEPATAASDLYSLGALLYDLCAGRPPHEGRSLEELRRSVLSGAPRPLAEAAAVDPRFGAIVDRCLSIDPAARFPSAEALRDSLQALCEGSAAAALPQGNPYRGLHAFEAEHRPLFFGRDPDIREVLERLRSDPFVLVAGDSGVGKSSLCRAGVLTALREIGGGRSWSAVTLVPGAHPLAALVAALAPFAAEDEATLAARIRDDPSALGRALRARLGTEAGLVVFVDQLEELCTLAPPDEAAAVAEVLGWLAVRSPALRVLGTVRGDHLTAVAALPRLGDEVGRAVYLLRPLGRAAIREAIVRPALATGVSFESEAMVEALLEPTERAGGGLPLLQFALAELWEQRDPARGVIPFSALSRIGGVAAALARHADSVIEGLGRPRRAVARRILLALVTPQGTRARCSGASLGAREAPVREVLDALVRARLLCVREEDGAAAYELAHETLVQGWPTLRAWLDEEAGNRAAAARLSAAVDEWERLGCAPDALWGARQLRELGSVGASDLSLRERRFLAASRAAVRRRRLWRALALAGIPLAVALSYATVALRASAMLDRKVDAHVDGARMALARARSSEARALGLQRDAFARFDAGDTSAGERVWAEALAIERQLARTYAEAAQALETALTLDGHRRDARSLLGDVLYARALQAERDRDPERLDELLKRLALYDEGGERRARWSAPARVSITSRPTGARVTVWRYDRDEHRRRLVPVGDLGATPIAEVPLERGSYLFVLSAQGRIDVRYPVVLDRGERAALRVDLPALHEVPAGFAYIPEGRFLFGSPDERLRRGFLGTVPLHEVRTGAYLIARRETTFGEWLEFLEALPPRERARRTPRVAAFSGGLEVKPLGGRGWRLALKSAGRTYSARSGEKIALAGRRDPQDWLRFPVSGISWDDAQAYVGWLQRTGRVPGARLCTEHEWERAARGADDRLYPHGDRLEAHDANFDETYGKQPLAFGPDEVGTHPASRSPFGVDDLVGNVWEWTRSVLPPARRVARGGSFYHDANSSQIANRQVPEPAIRDLTLGLRVCASFPAR